MKKLISIIAALMVSSTAYCEKLIVTYDNNGVVNAVSRYNENEEYEINEGFFAYIYDMDLKLKEEYKKPSGGGEENPPEEEIPPIQEEPKFPEIYEKEKDAITTFGIITNNARVLENDESVCRITMLYQGSERTFTVNDEVKITSAPDYWNELSGKTAEVLKRGDVINIVSSLNGKVREIGFITRIEQYDIITDDIDYGNNFENLYSSGGNVVWGNEKYPVNKFGTDSKERIEYQFGVISDKKDAFYTITNKAGKEDEFTYIAILPETIVYTCDINKKYEVALGTTADIRKSYIPSVDIDENGNILKWDEDTEYIYALSRTVNGLATDVVIFYGLK